MKIGELILLGSSVAFEILVIVAGTRLKTFIFMITSVGVFVIFMDRQVFF